MAVFSTICPVPIYPYPARGYPETMSKDDRIFAALLAAGRGQRFGAEKMSAMLRGSAVLSLSAQVLCDIPAGQKLAVLRRPAQTGLLPSGFVSICREGTQSDSMRCAVGWARTQGARALLITLGDMPCITPGLIGELIALYRGTAEPRPVCVQSPLDGSSPMPPAIFPASMFDDLQSVTGDRGARSLLRSLPSRQRLLTDPALLRDIDQPEDLRAATQALFKPPGPG